MKSKLELTLDMLNTSSDRESSRFSAQNVPPDLNTFLQEYITSLHKKIEELEAENFDLRQDREQMTQGMRDLQIAQKKMKIEMMSMKRQKIDLKSSKEDANSHSVSIELLDATSSSHHAGNGSPVNKELKENSTQSTMPSSTVVIDKQSKGSNQVIIDKAQSDEVLNEIRKLKDTVGVLQKSVQKISLEKEIMEKSLAEKAEENEKLKGELEEIKLQLSDSNFTLRNSELLFSKTPVLDEPIQPDTVPESNTIEFLKNEVEILTTEKLQFKEQIQLLQEQYDSIYDQLTSVKQSLMAFMANEQALNKKLIEKENLCTSLQNELYEMSKDQSKTIGSTGDLDMRDLKDRIRKLEKELCNSEENRKELCCEIQRISALEFSKSEELELKTVKLSLALVQLAMLKSELTRINTSSKSA